MTHLRVDSSAAKSMSERRGVGQTRHVQARFLWLQDKVAERELVVDKGNGKLNDADLVTKVQARSAMKEHLKTFGFHDGKLERVSRRQAGAVIRESFKDPGQTPLLSFAAWLE